MLIYEGKYTYKKEKAVRKQLKETYGKAKMNWGVIKYTDYEAKKKYDLESFEDAQVKTLIDAYKEGIIFTTLDTTYDKYGLLFTGAMNMKVEAFYYDEVESIKTNSAGVEKRQDRVLTNILSYGLAMWIFYVCFFGSSNGSSFYSFAIGAAIGALLSFRQVSVNYQTITFNFVDGTSKSLVTKQNYLGYYLSDLENRFKGRIVVDSGIYDKEEVITQ